MSGDTSQQTGPAAADEADPWVPSALEQERRAYRSSRARRSSIVAVLSTAALVGLAVGLIVTSPGWERVKETFFNWDKAVDSFPAVLEGLWLNIRIMLICAVLIAIFGLTLAVMRTIRGPVAFPLRLFATAYVDLFRGLPLLLVLFLLGFGAPALRLSGLPTSALFWGASALVLSYSAYVAEVFRSGIESVHPSQLLSAQALALSRSQAMRHVIVPQATRRVVPPLLNDFVSLQKDTALVASVSIFDALFTARDYANYNFNYTPYVVVACFFVAMTVPLARLCDWLAARVARRERAGAL